MAAGDPEPPTGGSRVPTNLAAETRQSTQPPRARSPRRPHHGPGARPPRHTAPRLRPSADAPVAERTIAPPATPDITRPPSDHSRHTDPAARPPRHTAPRPHPSADAPVAERGGAVLEKGDERTFPLAMGERGVAARFTGVIRSDP
ncbi:hypothetical protein GCM10010300_25130 [Streptomyces olivaceoviridis]|nr:hypothetical protein GCM10010300_25130 [Streptomyces olivaceoviridis]